jgi:flagellar biosynthesis protein FlhF
MNVKRFVGRTSGEAMRKLREALGPDALVLANRPCAEGVELLAAAPGLLGALEAGAAHAAPPAPVATPRPRPAGPGGPGASASVGGRADAAGDPGDAIAGAGPDAIEPSQMSTVSFQDYVRQRLRERSQGDGRADAGAVREAAARSRGPTDPRPASGPAPLADRHAPRAAQPRSRLASAEAGAPRAPVPEPMAPRPAARASVPPSTAARSSAGGPVDPRPTAPVRREPMLDGPDAPAGFVDGWGRPVDREASAAAAAAAAVDWRDDAPARRDPPPAAAANDAMVAELQSLKGMISRQFATISWFEGVRRSPVQGKLLRSMVAAGFSLKLARSVVSRLPSDCSERDAQVWLEEVLARNLRCAAPAQAFEAGGVFALIGPTGVGKTTTTAKIAARHVLKHGPQSVALITVDTYRLGAHDQLRAFGRILGVPVHIAHDASALHDLLRLRGTRQLVLIDTVGMGHRDERIRSLLTSLPRGDVRHVVVASCAAQAETIDASLRAYEARQAHGVVLTKLDEAARTGGALDCLLRQRLQLLGVCDGQRVPEDWQPADAGRLVRRALLSAPAGAFGLDDEELPLVFGVAATLQGGAAHA